MLIIPYVCADFRDKKGNPIFRITADMLRTMQDVPEAIKQDLLFDMLVQDGSIKTPETVAQRKLLEQDMYTSFPILVVLVKMYSRLVSPAPTRP